MLLTALFNRNYLGRWPDLRQGTDLQPRPSHWERIHLQGTDRPGNCLPSSCRRIGHPVGCPARTDPTSNHRNYKCPMSGKLYPPGRRGGRGFGGKIGGGVGLGRGVNRGGGKMQHKGTLSDVAGTGNPWTDQAVSCILPCRPAPPACSGWIPGTSHGSCAAEGIATSIGDYSLESDWIPPSGDCAMNAAGLYLYDAFANLKLLYESSRRLRDYLFSPAASSVSIPRRVRFASSFCFSVPDSITMFMYALAILVSLRH